MTRHFLAMSLAAAGVADAAIAIHLPGSSEQAVWAGLNAANYPGAGGSSSFFDPTAAWPGPVAANPGSTAGAVFSKVSGGGYFATSSVYDAGVAGMFSVFDSAPLAALATVVFQIDAGTAVNVAPVLNYNGGTQSLAADYFTTVAGSYLSSGPMGSNPSTNHAWQWDLGAVAEPITSYEIVWGSTTGNHLNHFELNLSAGDSFVQVVPEPSALMMVPLASFALIRRRR